MLTLFSRLLMLAFIGSVMGGCAALAPPPPTAPSPSVTAPINKANQTSDMVQEKAKEREQMNPKAEPSPSPSPSP